VDVGAGGSDAVAELLARGADAYAVDPRYAALAGLVRDANSYFARQTAAGQLPQAREASAPGIAAQRAAFGRFLASFQARKTQRRYLAAVASNLPFETASADFVYSLDCITQYLDREYDGLLGAVREALRVLKPGGTLALAPFRDDVFALGYHAARQANQERLITWLDEHGIIWRVDDLTPTGLTESGRLVVSAP
jgi:SAM-dependent methyltransferase